jgi:predicted Holliday junction resolvase-like endonuclease
MSARVKIVKLTIQIGDQQIDVTPEEYKALARAADDLIVPEVDENKERVRKMAEQLNKYVQQSHQSVMQKAYAGMVTPQDSSVIPDMTPYLSVTS